MKSFLRNLVLATVVALGLGSTAMVASACDCPPGYRIAEVVSYECRRVPYTVCETAYDECGRPYQRTVVRYRIVRVQVTRQVLIRVS